MVAADPPDSEPGLLHEDAIDQGRDDHEDVPVALQVLRNAVDVAEGQGWRLDSDAESGEEGAQDADPDRAPDPEDLRRQRRRRRMQVERPLPSDIPRQPEFTGIRTAHRVFQVGAFGSLRYDTSLRILAAHCSCGCHGVCRMNRTVKPAARRGEQGRPLGFLLAWLLAPHKYPATFPDRASHAELAVPNGTYSDHRVVSYEERCRLRAWARTLPDLEPIFLEGLEAGGGGAEEPIQLV